MKTKRKLLAILLSLAMTVNVFVPAISASELPAEPAAPAVAEQPVETPAQPQLPAEQPAPAPVPETPTAAPAAEPAPVTTPVAPAEPTPTASAVPTAAPAEDAVPDSTPTQAPQPVETSTESPALPDPTAQPTPTAAVAEGTAVPAPAEPTPTAPAEETEPAQPTASPAPTATAVPAEEAENTEETEQAAPASDLFDRLMACTTAADFDAAAEAATDEELAAITPEQDAALDAKYDALHANDAPAVPAAPAEEQEPVDVPVESEVIIPSRNVTDVAPFLEPVVGFAADPLRAPYRMTAPLFYAAQPESPKGVEVDKSAKANGDGTYTITLETYATGAKIITEETTSLPTDIVLVLDQSDSMKQKSIDKVTWESYRQKTNEELYGQRHNGGRGNLYYPVDGRYYSVSVVREGVGNVQPDAYTAISSSWKNEDYHEYAGQLYAKMDGQYVQVTVERSGRSSRSREYTYTANGKTIAESRGDRSTPGFDTDDGKLYQKTAGGAKDYRYTYSYTLEGQTVTIVTSEGNTSQPEPTFYYKNASGTEKRMQALVRALRIFTDEVEKKAMGADGQFGTEDDVHHRIAMVGFAGEDKDVTGLFVPETNGSFSKVKHSNIKTSQYQKAFMDMAESTGRKTVQNIIDDSSKGVQKTSGMTNSKIGMEVAKQVLQKNPVPEGEKRSRVVILFTDGAPEESDERGFSPKVARGAIDAANRIKAGGATVYSVGIFDGADASAPVVTGSGTSDTQKSNAYMQYVSSNNGVPQNPSYYLSAADSDSLNEIFALISQQIEEGGASTKLDEQAVIRDVIAESFQLPAGATAADIRLETYRCTGVDADGTYTWEPNHDAKGATATITNGNQVNVTGFDFAGNYVGTVTQNGAVTYRGSKLVISFEVEAKPGFLGGNYVPTNAQAHLYEKADSEKPVAEYPVPTVNVPVPAVEVTVPDLYIYLHGSLAADNQIKPDIQVKVNGQALDLTRKDLGLAPWQTAYVNLHVTNGMDDIVKAEQDTTYTYKFAIEPRIAGEYKPKADEKTGQIYVVKPTITWQDSQINLGETANYAQQNFVRVEWLHKGAPVPADQHIFGTEPTLSYTYNPSAAAFTKDTPVKVTVLLGADNVTQHTTFKHAECSFDGCRWGQPGFTDCQFIVHIKSFDLTITKTGTEPADKNQSFKFDITGPNGYKQSVVVHGNESVTIQGLPAGAYTVTEDTSWSGRYTPTQKTQQVSAADAVNGKAALTFTNRRTEDKWLDVNTGIENKWQGTNTIRRYLNGVLVDESAS